MSKSRPGEIEISIEPAQKPKWDGLFPFLNGNLQSYDDGWTKNVERRSKEAARFEGTLTYSDYRRGRSSALLVFMDKYAREYPFFLSQADELISYLKHGQITGVFEPIKVGQNYSWRLIEVKP